MKANIILKNNDEYKIQRFEDESHLNESLDVLADELWLNDATTFKGFALDNGEYIPDEYDPEIKKDDYCGKYDCNTALDHYNKFEDEECCNFIVDMNEFSGNDLYDVPKEYVIDYLANGGTHLDNETYNVESIGNCSDDHLSKSTEEDIDDASYTEDLVDTVATAEKETEIYVDEDPETGVRKIILDEDTAISNINNQITIHQADKENDINKIRVDNFEDFITALLDGDKVVNIDEDTNVSNIGGHININQIDEEGITHKTSFVDVNELVEALVAIR